MTRCVKVHASRGCPTCAHLAPISGKPEIGVCSASLRSALRSGHASEAVLRLQRDRRAMLRARPGAEQMDRRFFVYVLANRPRGILYIGVTNDLIRRLAAHKGKVVPGFTKT